MVTDELGLRCFEIGFSLDIMMLRLWPDRKRHVRTKPVQWGQRGPFDNKNASLHCIHNQFYTLYIGSYLILWVDLIQNLNFHLKSFSFPRPGTTPIERQLCLNGVRQHCDYVGFWREKLCYYMGNDLV
jgi:hypothetical protein